MWCCCIELHCVHAGLSKKAHYNKKQCSVHTKKLQPNKITTESSGSRQETNNSLTNVRCIAVLLHWWHNLQGFCYCKLGGCGILTFLCSDVQLIWATEPVPPTLSTQLLFTRRLPGLMSRCRMPAEWRYLSPGGGDGWRWGKTWQDDSTRQLLQSCSN